MIKGLIISFIIGAVFGLAQNWIWISWWDVSDNYRPCLVVHFPAIPTHGSDDWICFKPFQYYPMKVEIFQGQLNVIPK